MLNNGREARMGRGKEMKREGERQSKDGERYL
jgi:hypothetical protein